MFRVGVTLILFAILPHLAHSADSSGKFSIKSVATLNCAHFLLSREQGSEEYALFGGFIGGYITAYNQFVPATFDISPWQSADTLAGMLAHYCNDHRQENFGTALTSLVGVLKPGRIDKASERRLIERNQQVVAVYQSVLSDVLQRLKSEGYYQGELDADFNAGIATALEAFQKKHNLPVTGLPDQATLFRIYYR